MDSCMKPREELNVCKKNLVSLNFRCLNDRFDCNWLQTTRNQCLKYAENAPKQELLIMENKWILV